MTLRPRSIGWTECGAVMKGIKSSTEGLAFHSLRHTLITHMAELGVPIGVIQTFVAIFPPEWFAPIRTSARETHERQWSSWMHSRYCLQLW